MPSSLPPERACDHKIPLIPGARPFSLRPYRLAPELKDEVEKQIQEMLDSGVIRRSNSAFSSPILLVKKKDHTWRLVVDYRHLNALTIKGKFPMPVIDELLDELHGAQWFTKLDLRAGYHQIRLAPGEEYKTAFQTHHGHFEFVVMGFGLTGAPNTFQGAMNSSLSQKPKLLRHCVLVFFDDILVFSKTLEEHLQHVKEVLQILQKDKWYVKYSKCEFASQKLLYLGHVISTDGVSTDPSKISTIEQWPSPVSAKEVRSFLGLAGYYRKFIKHFGIIAKPLTNLLRKGVHFLWTTVEETAFQTLKHSLVTAPVLALPNFQENFVIETDASDYGIGAVLMQSGHPLAFVSRALGPRNQTLSVYEKEFLAILLAVEQWRSYLQLREFVIQIDQRALVNLTEQRLHTAWQQKALTKLMGLDYKIIYKKGSENGAADALSRRPISNSSVYALSTVQPAWLQEIVASYTTDPSSMSLLQKLSVDPSAVTNFSLDEGVLRYRNCIWVGADVQLQHKIIWNLHASSVGGHSGFPVTYRRVCQLFRWKNMKKIVKELVQQCDVCQLAKPERVPYPGLLQPLHVPKIPWEMMTMDFVEGLPVSNQFNCILVVIDKLSKFGHFIALKHPYTASKVADVFLDRVYRLHGLPQSLVSDRDPIFTSIFWKELCRRTGIKLCMSSGQHPQTDGQTERVNQQVEGYLRCFISAHPHRWSQWLPLCELWYNTNWHSSTGRSPFEIIYGHHPRYFGISPSDTVANPDVQQWLEDRHVIMESVRQHSLRAQQRMKVQADKNRTERVFVVGDSVFLKMQPYIQASIAPRANHKLAFRYFGPFKIVARVGAVAYELDLPEKCRVHPVFHVSLLKKHIKPGQQVLPVLPLPDVRMQVPARVLDRRIILHGDKTVVQVLIKWSLSPEALATWEDFELIKQEFPHAPAWGQAVFRQRGIVSSTQAARGNQIQESATTTEELHDGPQVGIGPRPRRVAKTPARIAGPEWTR